ncbi:FAD-binding protein [Temperatibacter marinus]|uniref:FAD-binding protein n=1 Tax=Temperatibacter marinus TaxID=1456591 RepID=A0AA52EJC5_9PROT|nr:FAD-binding protein [Temperatibacter marinus]WND03101.1 FAD-binding protein [Temperatibacter marinus]
MTKAFYKSDVCIIGGGLAGIVSALEILDAKPHQNVIIFDQDAENRFGGLALWAFGGMALVDTPAQARLKIDDSIERAKKDWYSFADFEATDHWPRAWADYYIENSNEKVFHWLKERGIGFLPAVQWVERGLHDRGNSVARYHVLWGTSQFMTKTLILRLKPYIDTGRLSLFHRHKVEGFTTQNGKITGCHGGDLASNKEFECDAGATIVATGGIGGNIDQVRRHWPPEWTEKGSPAPDVILNGCHPFGDGHLHDQTASLGGRVTHLDKMWNYAAGIPHPQADFEGHGLSLIPTRTSMWCNHEGKRINAGSMDPSKPPLITGFDTNYLCQQVAAQEKPWTWHIMNWDIARKELAISGAEHNPYIRDKKFITFVYSMLTARPWLIKRMAKESDHVITAMTLEELVQKMNALTDQPHIEVETLKAELDQYDALLSKAPGEIEDPQIRLIKTLREWSGDKLRTSNFKTIQSSQSLPYVAIKTYLIARKTLGGIQTNLKGQVLDSAGKPMEGLYAVGEAAGFGGGGASGKRSLEGTFLPGCILTGQSAARALYT